jgi:hypothetical protein
LPKECYYFKTTDLDLISSYFSEWSQIFPLTPINSITYEKDHIRATFIPISSCVLTEDKPTIFGLVKKVIETNPALSYESGKF